MLGFSLRQEMGSPKGYPKRVFHGNSQKLRHRVTGINLFMRIKISFSADIPRRPKFILCKPMANIPYVFSVIHKVQQRCHLFQV